MKEVIKSYLSFVFVMLTAATLLGFAAPQAPFLDIINNFRIHFILVILASLVLGELTGTRQATFWASVLLLVHLFLAIPAFYLSAPPAPVNSSGLRVLSFNMEGDTRELGRIASMLQEENADLILLLGISQSRAKFLDALGSLYPYQAVCSENYLCQMAFLSKRELYNVRFFDRREGMPASISLSIRVNKEKVHVLGVHLSNPLTSRNQRAESDYLVKKISSTYGPLILLGTFNATPWSWELSNFQMRTGMMRHRTLGANWPAQESPLFAQFLVDHVMTRGAFRTENAYTGKRVEANHLPIIVDLAGP